jgi:hypothetical protein
MYRRTVMRTRFSIGMVEAVKQDLDALPELDRELREIGLQDVIRTLGPSIRKLRARGYKTPRILELLKERGIDISSATLKNYLGEKRSPAAAKRGTKGDNQADANGGAATGVAVAVPNPAPATSAGRTVASTRIRE